uniref:LysR family transcriptional regulator n=1 Tax=unclassified Marinovum TaxID=2647166 RepID=UPI0026E25899|nr:MULTISPECIES: LysR family transcriptional regulator [unclassified Marinovum]MDO6731787.1 LysR family transcriptional regulator [Marinovum sp. 2_MG-2023]MDO6781039.1 LysR family transcriptional regulator [Marinovum sp. 1_MG-2023]
MLNATWLETFTTLCEVGHFTRTADRLGMTQPGVSQHLRKLEDQIGKPLIVRDGKTFTLSPAGEAVFAVGKARRAQEQALKEIVQVDEPDVGTVRIGCSGSFALWLYPHLLERMQQAPDLVIHLNATPQAGIVNGVLDGDLDLGIVTERMDHPRLETSLLTKEELCLVLPAGFATDGLTIQRLNALGFVAHPDGFAYANELLQKNFPDEYQGAEHLKIRTFVNQIGQIPIPVAKGIGYTILPKSGVDAFPQPEALTIYALHERRFHDLWTIARKGRSQFARISAIKATIDRATQSAG